LRSSSPRPPLVLPSFPTRRSSDLALAFFLNRWSWQQDQAASPQPTRRFRVLSGPGLVVYGLTITLAATDWVMSLEPHWYSTIFRSEEHTSELQSPCNLVCRLLLEK